MTHLLCRVAVDARIELAGIAHFNHRLRGAEADADEAFCAALAAQLKVPFTSDSADVSFYAGQARISVEDAARRLRYEFLERARAQLGADWVAVGHTRDDQAETWLMRLLRGAGPRGLSGIRRRRGVIIRPLLDVSRVELHRWLAEQGQPYRVDATNDDTSIVRNRIRHSILPAIERASPGAGEALARAAAIASEDDDFLDRHAAEAASRVVVMEADEARLLVADLHGLHPAMARRVVRDAMERVTPDRFVELKHVDAVLALAASGRGQLDGPGQQAVIVGEWLWLRSSGARQRSRPSETSNVFRYPLSIPGEARITESGVAISAEILDRPGPLRGMGDAAVVSAASLRGTLTVRNRRAGDRFRPFGLHGRKKLQDYFVDRKVPRDERDRVPLVVDADDRIVWVVGHAVAEDFRVTDPGGAVLLLKVRHLGGPRV
jgi:tRNA(Ile)-lysidine synthase